MLSVPVTWVKEGGMVRLDKKYLRADYKGVSADDVVYIIHTADGQPKYGNKKMRVYSGATADVFGTDSVLSEWLRLKLRF